MSDMNSPRSHAPAWERIRNEIKENKPSVRSASLPCSCVGVCTSHSVCILTEDGGNEKIDQLRADIDAIVAEIEA